MITSDKALAYHCPRWQELPNIPLYMDQVLMILGDALALFAEENEPAITAAMINNYVKQKLVEPPIKKKYDRTHIAELIVLTLFKKVFSMAEITGVINRITEAYGIEKAYDMFCDCLEDHLRGAFTPGAGARALKMEGDPVEILLCNALMALVCKLLVQNALLAEAPPPEAKKPAKK